ncbi:unnamed protein product [Merluccius merluccius]
MAHMCRRVAGSVASCAGWVGLIVATATNDWVSTCDYSVATCVRLDELGTQGLWADCVIAPALYHCVSLNQILSLPGCSEVAEGFRLQEIDGQALLLLTEDHLMTSMNIKLGPALKICAHINTLKNQ